MKEQDRQAALDALLELANTPMELSMADWCRISSTIRAALTAQDVDAEKYDALYGTIESQKQTHDAIIKMNKELLDACKVALGHMTGGMDGDWRDCDPIILLRDTIYRAEAQKVEED